MTDAIDDYLDELASRLSSDGPRLRRLLWESECHLRESAEALRAKGLPGEEAARQAVARFGGADEVAQSMRPDARALIGDLVRAGWLLAGCGLVAVGVSGGIAWLLRVTAGARFLAGDAFGVTYTPGRCAEYLEYFPDAGGCAAAAALHHSDEVVSYRLAAGVLGVLVLLAYRWFRTPRGTPGFRVIPRFVVPLVAATVFTLAAAALLVDSLGLAVGQLGHGEPAAGIGDPLSAGLVALVAAAAAAVRAYRSFTRVPDRQVAG
jgi:hypothetical protein